DVGTMRGKHMQVPLRRKGSSAGLAEPACWQRRSADHDLSAPDIAAPAPAPQPRTLQRGCAS
ncbi:MAG: hypothetical protein KDI80_17235, partial [Xanthomonadales bacterium]|nr:hypothetical protein [Xanthomonadales bacterium]